MKDSEYYKTLISDEEVIKALLTDSKARDGEEEKTRVRPNLTFFQRTVTNLVSSNKRLTNKQNDLIAKAKVKNVGYKPKKVPRRRINPLAIIQEILTNRIEFVKSSEDAGMKFGSNRLRTDVKKPSTKPDRIFGGGGFRHLHEKYSLQEKLCNKIQSAASIESHSKYLKELRRKLQEEDKFECPKSARMTSFTSVPSATSDSASMEDKNIIDNSFNTDSSLESSTSDSYVDGSTDFVKKVENFTSKS